MMPLEEVNPESFVNADEIKIILDQLKKGQGSFTSEQAANAINWAIKIRIDGTILNLVLKGLILIKIDSKGEVNYGMTPGARRWLIDKGYVKPNTSSPPPIIPEPEKPVTQEPEKPGGLIEDIESFLKGRREDKK